MKDFLDNDRRVTIQTIAEEFNVAHGTIWTILHQDLGLVLKSARWVPKQLTAEHREKRVNCAKNFKAMMRANPEFLTKIVTMDESNIPLFQPERKRTSSQWLKKGSAPPIKFKEAASRKKQMVVTFFDINGLIYQRILPERTSVNAATFIETLKEFFRKMNRKRPVLAKDGFFFHMDNAPAHSAHATRDFLAKKSTVTMVDHPPYSPNLAPADFFFFPKVKMQLEGVRIEDNGVQKVWCRASKTISKDDFTKAFERWVYRWEKCIRNGGGYVEK